MRSLPSGGKASPFMAQGSRVCPHCGKLNGIDEETCYSCGKRLPGPLMGAISGLLEDIRAQGFPLTKVFWGLCVFVFAASLSVDANPGALVTGFRDSTSVRFGALYAPWVSTEPFRLLSATFVHGNVLHIVFNSGALLYLGSIVENKLGSARFAVLFVLSAIAGFALSVYWDPRGSVVGASGGIFGLLGALTAMYLVRKDILLRSVVLPMLIFALIMTFVFPNISISSHLGGLGAGFALGLVFELGRRRRALDWLMTVLAVLAVGASVGSLVLSNRSPHWKELRLEEEMRGPH